MKKLFNLLMAGTMALAGLSMTSCDDDKDLPNVNISLNVEEGTVSDGTIYVVQGDPIKIAGINVTNNDEGKAATVANVSYYWDGYFYAPSPISPFGMTFNTTENTPLGDHTINITCNVLAVDKSLATAAVNVPVKVVASADELPESSADSPTLTQTTNLRQ